MKKILYALIFSVVFCSCVSVKANAISAKSAVVICGDTGEIIYSRNADKPMPMASTTKIMTALVLLESGDLNRLVTVTKDMILVEGTSMGLCVGDTVTLNDLLYGMMLCSGNDAANAIAAAVGGSNQRFAEMMNKKAQELGLENTHFVTPSGLDAEAHYTTAYELALITAQAMKYSEFRKAVASKSVTLTYGNPPVKRTLTNHNRLLMLYDDVVGVKTGFTSKSGRCLVSAAQKDGKYVIAVTLNDSNDWRDHRELLTLGLSSVSSVTLNEYRLNLPFATKNTERIISLSKEFNICTKSDEKISECVYVPKFLYLPVEKNETVGYIIIKSGKKEIRKTYIKSERKVKQKSTTSLQCFWLNFLNILGSINER